MALSTGPRPRRRKATTSTPDAGEVLRWPAGATLAPIPTRCGYCWLHPAVLKVVVDGTERLVDPLPLTVAGLTDAVHAGRWVGIVRPVGPVLIHTVTPTHPWLTATPTLLAGHAHSQSKASQLDHDLTAAAGLLRRLLVEAPPPRTTTDDPPF